jgi:hypothetical protein
MSLFHDPDVPLDRPLQRFSPMSRIRTYSDLLLHPDMLYIRTYTQRYNAQNKPRRVPITFKTSPNMDPTRERGAGGGSASSSSPPDSTSGSTVAEGRIKLKAQSPQLNLLSGAGGCTFTVGAAGARRHRLTNQRQVRRTPQ